MRASVKELFVCIGWEINAKRETNANSYTFTMSIKYHHAAIFRKTAPVIREISVSSNIPELPATSVQWVLEV